MLHALTEARISESNKLLVDALGQSERTTVIIDASTGYLINANRPLNMDDRCHAPLIDSLGNIVNIHLTDSSWTVQRRSHYHSWLGIASDIGQPLRLMEDIDKAISVGTCVARDRYNIVENKVFDNVKDLVAYSNKVRLQSLLLDNEKSVQEMRFLHPDVIALRNRCAPGLWRFLSSYQVVDWESVFHPFHIEYQLERDSITFPLGMVISIKVSI